MTESLPDRCDSVLDSFDESYAGDRNLQFFAVSFWDFYTRKTADLSRNIHYNWECDRSNPVSVSVSWEDKRSSSPELYYRYLDFRWWYFNDNKQSSGSGIVSVSVDIQIQVSGTWGEKMWIGAFLTTNIFICSPKWIFGPYFCIISLFTNCEKTQTANVFSSNMEILSDVVVFIQFLDLHEQNHYVWSAYTSCFRTSHWK